MRLADSQVFSRAKDDLTPGFQARAMVLQPSMPKLKTRTTTKSNQL
jgi:hypothetical protein